MTHKQMPIPLIVSYQVPAQEAKARALANRLSLPVIYPPPTHYNHLLQSEAGLVLQTTTAKNLYIDFNTATLNYRRKHANLHQEMLARACGLKQGQQYTLIDTTAGTGEDSFILAALGFPVIMIERSPIIHALLEDALLRAIINPELNMIISRLTLILADAISWLKESASQPDIIYLDPMFPPRHKSAAVRKKMQILQVILGEAKDTEALFAISLACAAQRVVVKRPRLALPLPGPKPTFTLEGRSSRFDVYQVTK